MFIKVDTWKINVKIKLKSNLRFFVEKKNRKRYCYPCKRPSDSKNPRWSIISCVMIQVIKILSVTKKKIIS